MANERNTPRNPGNETPKTPHPDREDRRIGDPETDRPEIEGGGGSTPGRQPGTGGGRNPAVDEDDDEMETGPGPRTGGKGERPNQQRTDQGGDRGKQNPQNPQNPAQDPERRNSTDRTGNR